MGNLKALRKDREAILTKMDLYKDLNYKSRVRSCQMDIDHIDQLIRLEEKKGKEMKGINEQEALTTESKGA